MLRHILIFCALLLPAIAWADAVDDLVNLKSADWRETPPKTELLQKHTGKEPLKLTVHYTDIAKNYKRSLKEKLRILFAYSTKSTEGTKKKLWGDIPYHYFLDANGMLGEARHPSYMPDSNTKYERDGHITIVVEGNAKDGITSAQKKKLFAFLKALQEKHKIATGRVSYHKHYADTDCPGAAIIKAVEEFKEAKILEK